jgi:hypothetical protein
MTALPATLQTALPATLVEAQATAFARDFLRRMRDCTDSPFGPAAVSTYVRPILVRMLETAEGQYRMIDYARAGWPEAIAILNSVALELRNRNEILPEALDIWVSEQLRNPAKPKPGPGPKKVAHVPRDIGISMTVSAVIDRFGLKPTGRSRHRRSACAVVADALSEIGEAIGYDAVVAVWRRYGRAMPTQPGWSYY